MKQKRLQVVIAEAGIASRRAAETLIAEGKVRVNGKPVSVQGTKVDPATDKIEVDGKLLKSAASEKKYYLFHKPLGVTATLKDAHASRTIADFFQDEPERVFPAGRLDKDSTGLLLMTNDGELVFRLSHPKFGIEKGYEVMTDQKLSFVQIKHFESGIVLDGKKTAPAKVKLVSSEQLVYRITLHEGRKRQIRRMMEELGVRVLKLQRSHYGPLALGNLKPGEKRALHAKELDALKKAVGL